MGYQMGEAEQARLEEFFFRIRWHLRDKRQRASFATYAFGLLSNCERKSVEPIAAKAAPDDCKRTQRRLCGFLREGAWKDEPVRLEAALYVLEALADRDGPRALIVDDTGFLKQGDESPGVQRQYTGSAGKVANCQIGVSLCIGTRHEQVPIDMELYLPREWADDLERRAKAHIPKHIQFKTKIELALDMLDRALAAGVPGDIMLADCGYGDSRVFRDTVRFSGLDYAVGVSKLAVWPMKDEKPDGPPITIQKFAQGLSRRAFRKISWRDGTSGRKLSSRFCFRRVKVAADDGTPLEEREPLWLMIEWPLDEEKPSKFMLTNLPEKMAKKQIVRFVKERWRTEQAYEEMKGELGLDHFEGRSWVGWHHHVTVVMCCYAFVVAERARSFPPSKRRTSPAREHRIAA